MRACWLLVLIALPARAADDFEIQVYDSETAAPSTVGFELHINTGGDHFTHFTLEPHVGLLSWLEAGAYIQTQLLPDASFEYAGVKLRLKARVPRRLHGVGLALNVEWSAEPEAGLGGELRPIIDVEWRGLYVSVNPIVSLGDRIEFEPAAKISIGVLSALALGAEWYGTTTPQQRLFGVIDVAHGKLGLNLGAGYSFGENQWLVKAIVSLEI